MKSESSTGILPIAEDPRSKAVLELSKKAAISNATVLISGETGVGKELIAHYIHSSSLVADGPFISVNCAALPESMIEAILFGYEKGAFTNALNSYVGKFEQADKGTLFLDEISEIPITLQGKLLRVLQERELERLGGKGLIHVNVRIIAATNRDLQAQVNSGYFRNDLYYRLNVIPVYCPPLRNRPLDILPLAEYFIKKHAEALGRTAPQLTHLARKKLLNYTWPGNVREIDNVIQRAVVMTSHNIIDLSDLIIDEENKIENEDKNILQQLDSRLKVSEAQIIMDVLKETEGCRGVAAKKLNISPRTLRYKISRLKAIGVKIP